MSLYLFTSTRARVFVVLPVWQAAISVFPLDFSDYITEKESYSSAFEVVYWKRFGSSAAVAVQREEGSAWTSVHRRFGLFIVTQGQKF